MNPALAAGGSGDVLAGFCAAIAARSAADMHTCACAAASLLVQAATPAALPAAKDIGGVFFDPAELARAAAALAGSAWLPQGNTYE